MPILPDIRLDGSLLDGTTVNVTLAENTQSGALIGQLTGGKAFRLVDDAGGAVFLDGNQLRLAPGALLDDIGQPTLTVTLKARDAAGVLVTVTAVISVQASSFHDVLLGTPGADDLGNQPINHDLFVGGAGNDTLHVDNSDVVAYSGKFSDYKVRVVLPPPPDGYGGATGPVRITVKDLRAGGPDGTDLILTDSVTSFHFADGDYSLDDLTAAGPTGLTIDGRMLDIGKYILENQAPGDIGQLGMRGVAGAAPVITFFEVLSFVQGQIFPITLTGANNPFVIDATGMLKTVAPLDYERFDNFTLRIGYQDVAGNSGFDIVKIETLDVDDAPVLTQAPGLTQAFKLTNFTDTTQDVLMGVLVATDQDGTTGTISFELGGADAGKFFVQDGKLFLKAGTVIDTGAAFDFDLTVTVVDSALATRQPVDLDIGIRVPDILESITWDFVAPQDIKVFLMPGGLAILEDYLDFTDTVTPFTSIAWSSVQVDAIKTAFGAFSAVANLTFTFVSSLAEADFAMIAAPILPNNALGDFAIRGGTLTAGGVAQVLDGWGRFDMSDFAGSDFAKGSRAFEVLLHEIGHGLGLAHPQDTGGGSVVMEGVTSDFGDYGAFDLNQAVYTVMSYNLGWETGPEGKPTDVLTGYSAALAALDIAVLQAKYGAAVAVHGGNDVYRLGSASFAALWDTGGTDTIRCDGAAAAVISLQEATLDYSATGGGVVSYVGGVRGGLTIAHGVVIENAMGGDGADLVTGNAVANRLTGRDGNDTLIGGAGDDLLTGGRGADRMEGGEGRDRVSYATASGVRIDLAAGTGAQGQAAGDVLIGIEDITGSQGADRLAGDAQANALEGGAGNDTLLGMDGNDTLKGDAGADVFVFGLGFGRDRLVDFGLDDVIQISQRLWDRVGVATVADFLATHAMQIGTRVDLSFTATDVLRLDQTNLADLQAHQDHILIV